ncbi:MAG TPA: non-ribosomal peptide synthase/polyketide synthase [Longimicrobium sp.]|jgi:amino acid adenylation domain-containing protein|uniref:non-ribosomal peptide synthase/polyketide synthase n=1 Tax=Longimicrobium sp. TaxID=2029185 RepID=UPI002ED7E2E6
MTDILTRLAGLSPEKQRLLALKLKLNAAAVAASAGHGGGERPSEFPTSFAQRRLWLLDRLEPGSTAYSMPRVWRIPGPLDVAALERALDELVRRHESLRTHLEERGGEPVQVVAPPAPFRLEVTDLSTLAPGEAGAELQRLAHADASTPFRLEEGPLFRASLVRLAAHEHALLWNLHHAVTDGWSSGILARELAALYQAFSRGEPSPLAPLPLQYGDHALRELERLSGDALARLVGFWRNTLEGAPTRLEIAPDRPRPAVRTHRGGVVAASLGAGLPARVDALARAHDATPFMVYLAAFQLLLGRYARQDDVLVGTAVANRASADVEGIVGFFVNTLVLRGDLSGDPTFAELLGRVREATLGAFDHQALPFEKLVEELNPERSLTHAPLVQAVIVLHNQHGVGGGPAAAAPARAAGPALRLEAAGSAEEDARFDLTLELGQGPDGVHARLSYATDLFERGTALRMLGHLARVLEQVGANADVRLSRLELLGDAERRQVVEEWNRTERPYPRGVCIHELFDAQVRERPGAAALVWGEESLNYRELDVRANQLANHLAGLGVGPDARVGVLLERSVELVVSILAVLKAGGCYVPLDPGYPPERLRLMLADSSVRVLLTRSDLSGVVQAGGLHVVHLDEAADVLASEPTDAPRSGATPENLAYIVYTSGSTGKPKGVMVAHRHVVQLVVETDYVQIHPGDRVAQASNASFDALTFEAWGAFLNGATLVGIPRDVLLSPPALREMLREERITTLYQTTALLNQLSREQPDVFAPLRDVLFGGQAVDADSVRRLLKAGGPERLVHVYGPTETTAWCSWEQVEQVAEDALTVSVGRPTGNQRIYLLDSALNPVPVGVPGEAYVGGDGVVRGYLDRPGLTAERFLPDPFAAQPGARMYRTGDRLRWKADGRLEFIGRVDEQVKVRGFRIEPGEIEAVLSAHAEVREARVIVSDDASGEKRLVAYVVGSVDAEELRAHLREGLPEYMVPAAFVGLEQLPLTPTGKLDVGALPAPEYTSAEDEYLAPSTPVEEVLAGIWAQVLRLERVGVKENFFEVGGHSLLATRVVSRVREVFGVEVPLRALFEGPTVAELARRVEEMRRAGLPVLPPVVPVGRSGALPLSFAQERLWFIDRLEPGSAVYNLPVARRLGGALDEAALERALGEIVRRHEALRTVFREVDGSPVQVIAPFDAFVLPVEDLSALAEADREAAVGRRAGEEARRTFDLAAGPLFRAALLRLGAEEHVLLLSMHHIVSDGWSMGVLFRELWALYEAYRAGRASPLPELPVQYADYAVWQREQLAGEVLDRQLAYWRERLAGAPELLELPLDRPRPAAQTFRGATVPLQLSPELLARLQALGQSEGATLYMTLLSAFQLLLSRYGAGDDVVVGSPIAGRTRGEVEELIGFFVNTLVLRTDLSGNPSFRETLRRVREATLDAYAHQEVPFEKLVAELQPERSLSHSPLFQVMFTLEDAGGAGGALSGPRAGGAGAQTEIAKFDLSLTAGVGAQGLHAALNYNTDLFERGTAERMLGNLARVLEQVAADADVRLSRLELLGQAERALVLQAWNRTERPYPRGVCVHELFEAQVRERPEAVALAWGDESLTYRELEARANQLANHLVGLGVGPDARVGVMLERGVELVVSLLAVLKAGGCYVPLDPEYPAERLRLMLEDSRVRVLLSRGGLAGEVETGGLEVVHLDRAAGAIASESGEAPLSRATAENLAYIVYTSGSTGKPKGVMVGHRQVVQLVVETDYVRLRPGDRVAQASNAGFDALTFEVWGAFLNGATLVGIPQDVLLSPRALRKALREERITTLFLTTALVNQLAHEEPDVFAPVREVLFGGQAVDAGSVRRLLKAGQPERLLHMYGPTETTTFCLYEEVEQVADDALSVPLGHATGNQRVYLLDGALNPVPRGVPGEAYVGGGGVARGYLDRPGLTAERFVPDPFSTEPGARMYRTGDRMRWRGERKLEFVGRVDEQVKIRGFRIEPGEVESALSAHAAVREARVVVREDVPGEPRLVAYVVGAVEADGLREHLRRTLPEYMVPSAFVFLEALPLTPNGKVDRKALPAPELGSAEEAYVAPRTPTEEVLAGIWAEVLRLERVGVEESFFDLGGHSLLGTRVVSRVREVFGVELPLRAVFERPVLRELAAEVDGLRGTGGSAGAGAISPAAREGDLPVTFAQERLWFVDALDPGSPAYAMPFSYRITGHFDDDALRRALAELVRRHEPLRTTLPAVDGVPVQRIAPAPASFDLPVTDLRHLPPEERRAGAGRLTAEASRHRFDLERGPLFRASLVHVADDEHLLLLNLHHSVGDGWSLGVLLEELSALYGAFSRGEASPLPEPALQYADYAVWQRERLSGAALERQVEFWRQALEGAPALLELPTDRPRPPAESHRGGVERMFVPPALTADVQALARREGATLFMVLLAALDVVLGRLAGQEDVVVGTPIAGRTRAETDRMVGLFLNSLALRTDLSGDPSFRELLGRVRESTLDAYAHQDLPFERVLEEVRPERSLAHAPVFQVMLNLANFQDEGFQAEGLEVGGAEAGAGGEASSKFDLTLYVGERNGGIGVSLVYAADLFDALRMRELLAQFQGVLRQAAAAPETRVGALSLATRMARDVLPDPARPIEAEPWRGAVHETFAALAAESPESTAVSDASETWTYAELDAAANRIAHRLIDCGVKPGDVVAVYAHRSAALVRAMLGTWKAGAAFAILDPAYPPARLAAQVRASKPLVILLVTAAGDVPSDLIEALGESVKGAIVLGPKSDDPDSIARFPATAPAVTVGPDDLAYVAFTSGTTGTPKAIAGTHRPLAHFFGWYAKEFGIGAADRVSLLSGLAHDPLLRDVFAPLAVGGSIAIPDPGQIGTPGWLAGWMRDFGVTVAHLTPAMAQIVASSADAHLPALRLACFGGDVLRAADVERLRALAPNAEAVNFYGATETPQAMGFFRLPADLASVGPAVPLGRGIEGVDLLVITPSGTLAGIGERGEIAVRTPYLSRGYLNDAELTACRFVPNPLTGHPADRVYRTGDLGRYRPDGAVEPVGRADQQVKVRGFRVELGEVESALASHPAIREAAVIAREAEGGDGRLVAYWVPSDEGADAPDGAAFRAHLKALVPEYMVPSAYVRLERLPLTANGKLDRRALPEPEALAADSAPAAPRTPTEEILAQIWAEVLRLDSVGVNEDFFALGGHSLLATRLLARVQNTLGVVLPLRAVFEGPTVAELAVRVEEMRRDGLPVLAPVVPVGRDRPLPLSFAQERLWFMDRLEGANAAYNIPAALRVRGVLDVDALERSLGEIVRRHESLRTVFREVNGGAVQVIAPFAGFALPVDDLSSLPEADRETEVRRRARDDAARPFDLAQGPLFRAALLRVADEEHVLLMCIHHIVTDGWSSGVLFRELNTLYAAFARGQASPLGEPALQYADYAVWQRGQLGGDALDRQIGYWKERLAGAPALLELPTDRPRPPVQSHRGAREMFGLPRALLDGLQALGRGEGATLYMVMLAAFQLLLSKYSGSDDVVVGSPIAGRTTKEVEELIGFFANTLVLRTDLGGDPTFRELLGRVREGTLGAYEHQEVPFERLVAELQPERSLSHSPVFQVMFTLQNADRSGSGLKGLRMEGMGGEVETTRFDLSLTAVPNDDGLRGALEYSTALFDRSTVRRMLEHLGRVLEQVAANADVRLSRLELLSAEERGLVVEAWNATDAEYPADACLHELVEAQAERTPNAVAVVFEDRSLTYAKLNARANRLAHHLRSLGVVPDARVAVCVERSAEMVVALLAVMKAGGAYVPLDPGHPAERLEYMLADSAPAAVLAQTHFRDRVEHTGVPVLEMGADRPEWGDHPATDPAIGGLTPAHLAYVIYTSGSTGRPKGVAVPHRGVVNLLRSMRETVAMEPADRLLAVTTYAFDISVLEIFLPLLHGAATIVLPRERAADPAALAEAIRAYAPTVMQATPATWRMLVSAEWAGAPEMRALCGGEALPAELASAVRSRVGALWNVYGPTETTIWSTSQAVRGDSAGGGQVPIGRPVANTRVYVLDAAGEPVPVGVAGELYIGGAGVVRGYLGRPELTAERFVADPFSRAPGARMYRTGDLTRWRPDGTIEYLGRTDFQVKVRGFRIEPGEIEARLAEHPGVREAAVVAREDLPGDVRLVAYVVGEADAEALRAHLATALPEYMVPAAYVRLDAFPLTPNGKLDRKALPAPEGDAYASRQYEEPAGKIEVALAEIWTELLRVERVGRRDHFFELGGHSLLALQVVSRVREAMEVELPLSTLFEKPVLAALAEELLELRLAGFDPKTLARLAPLARQPDVREGRVPLSFSQQRLWFLEQLGDLGGTYHISQRLPLRGELDRAALVRALDRIVARHEALRTTFAQVDGVPEQRIGPADTGFRLEEHDLGGQANAQAELGRLLAEEARAPFDLERGPLIRGRLIRVAPDHHVLAVTMHHIVSDAWSMELFTQELGALYGAFRSGEPDPLPPLPVQYADYAAWQRKWVEGDVLQAQAEYWTETLAGAPELLELPTDHPRPVQMDHVGGRLAVELDEALTAGLKALGQRHGATLFMTVLAGWATVLGRLSRQEDVVVGTPTASRGRIEIEGLIGFFVNTLALRVDLAGSPSVAEALKRVRERALGAQQNQDIPFEQVVELVQPSRSMAHSPLFQVMFGWQSAPRGGLELPGLTLESGSAGAAGSAGSAGSASEAAASAGAASEAAAKFDLSLDLAERGGRIAGSVTYAASLFEHATVERWAVYLRRVLEAMVADERQPVDRLPLLPEHERRQVVEEWNATDAEYPADACLHELFEAQAERTPDAVAVVFEDRSLTYAELNRRANRLAHHLRGRGVGPDVRVGICVERSPEMVVGLLAVLKAGGAYVPLDPSYPAERLEYMLADSAPAAVLTQRSLHGVEALFAGIEAPVIDLAGAEWGDHPATNPERGALTSGHLAYVIYTSGSTGRPKGVAVPHRGVVNHHRAFRQIVGMEAADRVLAVTTYAFDPSVLEIFLPLFHGARIIVLPRERSADPVALAEAIRAYAPTVMQATPVTWRMLVQAGWEGAPDVRALCGGEALPAELASALRSRVGTLWNVYGPTETTIWSTTQRVGGDIAGGQVPVGRPLANARLYVLDAAGEPVPVGVAGELYIGGAGVVRGYLGRPELTAERFVADPFSRVPGARMYRTGDLTRWRPDGTIEYLGRTDFQVKVRGFRIELGEIEARLAEHPGVREAAVVAREDLPGDVRLVAYVVGEADAESLRAHLAAALPEYMVPAAYVRMEAFPLTPTGKLDRKALPAPEGDAYASREYEEPEGKIEVALAEIWTELLRVERVGRRDHFFELGGHSLLALRVVSRVRQSMEVELPLAAVFEKPVLAALAEHVLELRLARFDPETLARLAHLVRQAGAETEEPE